MSPIPEKRVHQLFEVSVALKGLSALFECLGGLFLLFVSTDTIRAVVQLLTQDELVEDPKDFIAGHLAQWAQTFSVSSKDFFVFYLLSHGLVKLVLVVALLRDRQWAYPASLVVLTLFIAYQVYRFSLTQSLGLALLTIFDFLVIFLIWHEYRLIRQHRPRE